MKDILEIKSEQEVFKIIDKDLYAYTRSNGEKRNISEHGCDVLAFKLQEIEDNKKVILELQKRIEEIKNINAENYKLVGELYKCGFCDKSNIIQSHDSLTGAITEKKNQHRANCRNASKGGD